MLKNKIIVVITFVLMITANILAGVGFFNGVTTSEVSNSYPNLFAPAGITFAIWGVIYALLGIFTIYQFISRTLEENIRKWFSASSVLNTLWIISWSYYKIGLSAAIIIALLICLGVIVDALKSKGFWLKLPFSIYFGWITIATIANITTFLVSIGFNGFGIPETVWTIIVLILGTVILSAVTIKNKDFPYGLTGIWGYFGILIKHVSTQYFAGQYPDIITTITICIAVQIIASIIALIRQVKKK